MPSVTDVRHTLLPDDPRTGALDPRLRVRFDARTELGTACVIVATGTGGEYLGQGFAGTQQGLLETSTEHRDVSTVVLLERRPRGEIDLEFDCRTGDEWDVAAVRGSGPARLPDLRAPD